MFSDALKNKFYKISVTIIFILGILLRLYSFVVFRPLWRDECSLALNIYFGNFLDLWKVLLHIQSAPPVFMTVCKLFNSVNPFLPEYFLRLFPLISGLLSIYLFFLVTKKLFDSKLAIILANFIFAVNTQLIYYSHEFKQYSTDVMVVLGCIWYLSKINLSELGKKQILLNAILLAVLPLLSVPAFFVMAAWFIVSALKKSNIKNLILTIIPILVINIPYYLFILKPSKKIMTENFNFLWGKGFLSLNFNSIYYVIKTNLSFYFQQCKYIIIPLLMVLVGFILIAKRRREIDKLISVMIFLVITASFLHLYPIFNRVSLYLLPFAILFTVMPLNYLKSKWLKIVFGLVLCFFLFGKNNYGIINRDVENPAMMMKILKENYQKGDYVIHNDMSDSQYILYLYIHGFKVTDNKEGVIRLADYGEDWYYSILNKLPKGKRYWFFYSYDIDTKPVVPLLKNWASKNGKILYKWCPNKKSCLLCVQL